MHVSTKSRFFQQNEANRRQLLVLDCLYSGTLHISYDCVIMVYGYSSGIEWPCLFVLCVCFQYSVTKLRPGNQFHTYNRYRIVSNMNTSNDRQWLLRCRANPADPALRRMGLYVARTTDSYCFPPPPTRQSRRGRTPPVCWPQNEAVTAIRLPGLLQESEKQHSTSHKLLDFESRGNVYGNHSQSNQHSTGSQGLTNKLFEMCSL